MKIPRNQECDCGHLGSQHVEETGKCARCECVRFHHPSAKEAWHYASNRPYRTRPIAPPTRDSR